MATVQYLTLWIASFAGAALFGLLTHYVHAHFQAYPDKTIEGFRMRDHALNEFLNDNYVFWAHYDEDGWWEFYSLRNYMIHTAVPLFTVLIVGVAHWGDRAAAVESVCHQAHEIGLNPRLCNT